MLYIKTKKNPIESSKLTWNYYLKSQTKIKKIKSPEIVFHVINNYGSYLVCLKLI